MLPVLSKVRSVVTSVFEVEVSQERTISLVRLGSLYILASLVQASWLFLIFRHWEAAKEWATLPSIGWVTVIIWVGMVWCIPHLFYVGCRLIGFGLDVTARVVQTDRDKSVMRTVTILLLLGILLDCVIVPFIYNQPDEGVIMLFTALMGGRVLQANIEAILQYHRA